MDPLTFFWLVLKASLFSNGGMSNLPSLHSDLLARGWATDRHFVEALAVGQISPGPSGLWVVSLGYLTGGLPGAIGATIAASVPPLLILPIDRLHRRIGDHPAMKGFVRGLGLSVIGVFVVVMVGLLSGNGIDAKSLLIAAAAAGLGLHKRIPVVVPLSLAALAGALLYS